MEFVETYVALADHEQAEFQQFVGNDPEYTQVQQMITTYEQKGKLEGKLEGKKEGKKEGKQEDLILVLEKKFGKLGDAQKQRVRQIESTSELESLLLAALDAVRLEDLPL